MTQLSTLSDGTTAGANGGDLKRLSVNLPAWMVDDMQRRARSQGITLTELVRRGIVLERKLFEDKDNEVIVRNARTNRETVLTVL